MLMLNVFYNIVLQMELLDKFPVEGGQKDPKRRIIPFLPGKHHPRMRLSIHILKSIHSQQKFSSVLLAQTNPAAESSAYEAP